MAEMRVSRIRAYTFGAVKRAHLVSLSGRNECNARGAQTRSIAVPSAGLGAARVVPCQRHWPRRAVQSSPDAVGGLQAGQLAAAQLSPLYALFFTRALGVAYVRHPGGRRAAGDHCAVRDPRVARGQCPLVWFESAGCGREAAGARAGVLHLQRSLGPSGARACRSHTVIYTYLTMKWRHGRL